MAMICKNIKPAADPKLGGKTLTVSWELKTRKERKATCLEKIDKIAWRRKLEEKSR